VTDVEYRAWRQVQALKGFAIHCAAAGFVVGIMLGVAFTLMLVAAN
jgi:hypothetical protein